VRTPGGGTGGSGTLGLHEVYEAAARLEKADPDATPELLTELLDSLKQEQGRALESIRKYLASS